MASSQKRHPLLRPRSSSVFIHASDYSNPATQERATITSWFKTSYGVFQRGTVFWRIWPSILLHSLWAAVVWALRRFRVADLALDSVLLTVVGLVVGFSVSYRTSTGQDRYLEGRTLWATLQRGSRTIGRLLWHHVPAQTAEEHREKKCVSKLLLAYGISTKHSLRHEHGFLWIDLYPLVSWLPRFKGLQVYEMPDPDDPDQPTTGREFRSPPSQDPSPSTSAVFDHRVDPASPVAYGTFATGGHANSSTPLLSPVGKRSSASDVSVSVPPPASSDVHDGLRQRKPWYSTLFAAQSAVLVGKGCGQNAPLMADAEFDSVDARKARNFNVPLFILGELSAYVEALDRRGGMAAGALSGMWNALQTLEETLSGLEKIASTPLPVTYAAHLRHTVWIYLIALPLQLVSRFGIITIPAVAIASFLFQGFLAAGDELQQPFGYDSNDLDLDFFCDLLRKDLKQLEKGTTTEKSTRWVIEGTGRPA